MPGGGHGARRLGFGPGAHVGAPAGARRRRNNRRRRRSGGSRARNRRGGGAGPRRVGARPRHDGNASPGGPQGVAAERHGVRAPLRRGGRPRRRGPLDRRRGGLEEHGGPYARGRRRGGARRCRREGCAGAGRRAAVRRPGGGGGVRVGRAAGDGGRSFGGGRRVGRLPLGRLARPLRRCPARPSALRVPAPPRAVGRPTGLRRRRAATPPRGGGCGLLRVPGRRAAVAAGLRSPPRA